MKKTTQKTLILLIVLALAVTACNGSESDKTQSEDPVAGVYTAVAQTMEALPTQPPSTPTLYVAPATITPFATQIITTPTQGQPLQPTFAPVVQASVSSCKDAVYMSDVTIPDGTILTAGESFEKTWLILNSGTCAWESTYILGFVSGDEMSGVATAVGDTVSSNGQAQVSVTFTAPLTAGTYTSYWQMTDGNGTYFGNTIFVSIVVSDDATSTSTATSTATATSEYTSTPTSTSAATSTPTSTSIPTTTYTPTTVPTNTPVPTNTSAPTDTPTP